MPAPKKAPATPIPPQQIQKWQATAEGMGLELVEVSHRISKEIREALRESGVKVFKDALYTVGGESITENRIVAEGLSTRRLDVPTTEWAAPDVWKSKSTKVHYVIKEGEDTGLER